MSGPRFRTVLFDLDGTLIDSEALILASYRHTMKVHLEEVPPDEAWLEGMGTPLIVQLRDFARDAEEARSMLRTYQAHNALMHRELLRRFPGAEEALARLRAGGVRLGIVTSKLRESALEGMRLCDLDPDWFETIVTADDPVAPKPDPAPVLRALSNLDEEPGGAVFVGDTVWDLRSGRAAGTATAAALWGPFPRETLEAEAPDYLLEEIDQVLDIVG